jgi:CBS domain containing-hemolysin-like protein
MTGELIVAISLTIGISALCSTLEAMILSVTSAELESFKKSSPKRGLLLEKFRNEIEETTSAILSLNTIANTLGATLVGGLAEKSLGGGQTNLLVFACGMTAGILFFAEILPKNLTVTYRADLLGKLVIPLFIVRRLMYPLSKICKVTVKAMVPEKQQSDDSDEQEIILLAKKGAIKGTLTDEESNWVTNALRLNDVQVHEIMTPRTVMLALDQNLSVQEVFEMHPNVPFARIPLFRETIDHICGIVRRRDLYNANVEGKTDQLLKNLGKEAVFVPENASADKALRLLLSEHCQLSIVVDEFGSVAGVLALEDIIETIIGQEIFEHDDMAVDMREFAIRKHKARIKEEKIQANEKSGSST